jgi:hypothetical protein
VPEIVAFVVVTGRQPYPSEKFDWPQLAMMPEELTLETVPDQYVPAGVAATTGVLVGAVAGNADDPKLIVVAVIDGRFDRSPHIWKYCPTFGVPEIIAPVVVTGKQP